MNNETYEALKRIKDLLWALLPKYKGDKPSVAKDIRQVESWIDEVAKEYVDDSKNEAVCGNCGGVKDVVGTEVIVSDTGAKFDLWLCKNCRENDYGEVNNDD